MRLPRINLLLLFVLGIVLLLRLPSLWEPYWYGDEQIYLALAQAMNRGAVLYRDIWDNKPPLLYALYAIVPTLLWAKAAATLFVLGTCTGIYYLTRSILKKDKLNSFGSLVSALAAGVLLSVPLYEGTIANAELFFTLPIVLAAALIFSKRSQPPISNLKLVILGLLMFLAFLFKVPAVFDFVGMFLFWFMAIARDEFKTPEIVNNRVLRFQSQSFQGRLQTLSKIVYISLKTFVPIFLTFALFVAFVFAYFFFNQALKDFLIASFSQNASYVAVDSGTLSKLNNPLFIKALILTVSSFLLAAGYFKKLISKELFFLALWFGFSLYGALLSNRPYMHYLLQIVPPGVILSIYFFSSIWDRPINGLKNSFIFQKIAWGTALIAFIFVLFYLSNMFKGAFALPTKPYFQNFYDFASEKKNWNDYASFFDRRTLNSYAIAKFIDQNSKPSDSIFVWGDAASVYVLSNRPAATRFIQAHHLTTIDQANYDLIIERLNLVKPKFIIIDRPVHFEFSKLEELVAKKYRQVAVFENLHVYRKVL